MSDAGFLKCSCRQCGGHIEFPAAGVGLTIDCPHCGQKTALTRETPARANGAPTEQPPLESSAARPEGRRPASLAALVVTVLVLGIGAGGFYWYQHHGGKTGTETFTAERPVAPGPAKAATDADATPQTGTPTPVAQVFAPKSPDDLKVGPITLEKGKGTGLVYAVGVLTNNSDYQRFGVKLELDLLDAKGEKVGTAKDYRAVLESRQNWRFRALVLDNRATAARLASVDEDQ